MRGFKSIFSIVLAVLFLSSIQSSVDTFVETSLTKGEQYMLNS